MPHYNVLTQELSAFNDKVVTTARSPRTSQLLAFAASVYLHGIPGHAFVLHMGLVCVDPSLQRTGATILVCYNLLSHLATTHPSGFWLTSLAEVPSSLGSLAKYASGVFPSPVHPAAPLVIPSDTHLAIARAISNYHRDKMAISSDAVFDEERFVFRGSNPPGSPFRKDFLAEKYSHRDPMVDRFFKGLFRRNEGDEVLQVGFFDKKGLDAVIEREATRFWSLATIKVRPPRLPKYGPRDICREYKVAETVNVQSLQNFSLRELCTKFRFGGCIAAVGVRREYEESDKTM